jgi:hypothetical protein
MVYVCLDLLDRILRKNVEGSDRCLYSAMGRENPRKSQLVYSVSCERFEPGFFAHEAQVPSAISGRWM